MIALVALALFLPVALYLCKRTPRALGVSLLVVGGSVLLPENTVLVDLPLIPAIEKDRVIYLSVLIALLVTNRDAFRHGRVGRHPEVLFALMVIGFLFTWSFNTLPVIDNGAVVAPIGPYWVLARTMDDLLSFFLPFLIGRAAFQSAADLRTLTYIIVAAGVAYVPVLLIEVIMSIPFQVWQLHYVIYGVPLMPSWRWGGVQAIGFMDNALATASFLALSVILAAAYAASAPVTNWFGVRRAHLSTQLALLMTRVSSLNLYGIAFGATIRWLGARIAARVALLLALIVCAYPALRLANLFPDEQLVSLAATYINEERARSFEGRFLEEDMIFGVAGERLWFGWGMYDRIPNVSVFSATDFSLDSFLVIRVGLTGLVGVELVMLLLVLPIWYAGRASKVVADPLTKALLAAMMLCVTVRMLDYLMNGMWDCIPFFLAGALYGVSRAISGYGPIEKASPRQRRQG